MNIQHPTPNIQHPTGASRTNPRARFFGRWMLGVGCWMFSPVGSEIRLHPRRDQQPIREHRALVRLPVAIGVFEDEDLVVRRLAGRDLRVKRRGADPEAALGIPVHLGRLFEERILGPELDLIAFLDGELW